MSPQAMGMVTVMVTELVSVIQSRKKKTNKGKNQNNQHTPKCHANY